MEDSVMSRRIGLTLVAIASFAAAFATADDAEARHRRRGGSCGSWGGNGSWGSNGSHGGFFSRRRNGSHGSNGSWGSNGSHGGSYNSNSCGSHGGSYQGGSYEVVEESAPQAASVEGGRGEVRYYGERGETFQGGRRESRSTFDDRSMRSEGRADVDLESRDARERRDFDSSRQQDGQRENQDQSQDSRDSRQDSNQNQNQDRTDNQNENRTQNDNQQSPRPPSPPSGT
jgi:hypothetical protein